MDRLEKFWQLISIAGQASFSLFHGGLKHLLANHGINIRIPIEISAGIAMTLKRLFKPKRHAVSHFYSLSTLLRKWTLKWWWIHVIDSFWILQMLVLRILTDGTLTAREAMNLKRLQGSKTLNKTNYMYRVLRPKVNIFAAYKSLLLLLKMHFRPHREKI